MKAIKRIAEYVKANPKTGNLSPEKEKLLAASFDWYQRHPSSEEEGVISSCDLSEFYARMPESVLEPVSKNLREALEWEKEHPLSERDMADYDIDAAFASIEARIDRMRSSLP